MTFLIQQTLIYAVPLMIVALAGVFAERSGIINLALEGIMIFGAFIGVLFVRLMQGSQAVLAAKQAGDWVALQGLELLTMLVAAAMGAVFSLLLSFASINLRADQTIGGTALNLLATAIAVVIAKSFARIFYRNSINIGLPIMECPEAVDAISAGDTVSVDFDTGVITDETNGKVFHAEPFPPFIQNIISAGGLMKAIQK